MMHPVCPPQRVIGVVLASGSGRRFDPEGRQNKLVSRLPGGEAVVRSSVQALCEVLDDVVVTVRPGARMVMDCLQGQGCHILECPEAEHGIGSAIAAAVAYVTWRYPDATGCLIALGDMPFLQSGTVTQLIAALQHNDLVAPVFRGQRGHPVGFSCAYFNALVRLTGDSGARLLLASAGERLCCVPVTDRGVIADVDLPSDLFQ